MKIWECKDLAIEILAFSRYCTTWRLGYSRCNFRNKLNVECNRIVMDIERHLVSVHKLDKFGFKFEKLAIEI